MYESALRRKLAFSSIMPVEERDQITGAIESLANRPRELAELVAIFNAEVSAHTIASIRKERASQAEIARYWLNNDRRK